MSYNNTVKLVCLKLKVHALVGIQAFEIGDTSDTVRILQTPTVK